MNRERCEISESVMKSYPISQIPTNISRSQKELFWGYLRDRRELHLRTVREARKSQVKISKDPDIVVTPGGRHVWVNTNAGRIRKPVSFVGVTNSLN